MRILSGIQPTDPPHIGNYFGMMDPAIQLQDEGEALYFIADYHALTTVKDPAQMEKNVRDVALDFLACGLDPDKAIFFRQSDLPEVAELMWMLATVTPMGLIERCHSYKDKVAKGIVASHGLFSYPVLMAADILMYDSEIVPVGKDQKQHVEVTRDIAIKINETFGADTLKIPEPRIRESTATVPGVDGQKMSKSYGNAIPLFGNEKQLRKAIMKIPTDSTAVEDPKPTENSVVLDLYKLFASESDHAQMIADFEAGGFGYGDFKGRLFDAYWAHFADARAKRVELEADPGYIDSVLTSGAERARAIATPVMDRMRKATGMSARR